ncbi:MAG: hypothetical protein ACYC63_15685 [Armatimonadota bacterium]
MRPSRFSRALRIFGLILATLVVIGAALWTVADIKYGRMLERELAGLKARGYPLTIAEAKPRPAPDAENAAPDYMKLFGDLHFEPPRTERPEDKGLGRYKLTGRLGGTAEPFGLATRFGLETALASRKMLESTEVSQALAALDHASRKPYCVFPIPWEKGPQVMFPHLTQFRQGARLLAAQALLDAHDGDLPRALDRLAVAYRMADHVAQEPMLIQQFAAYAVRGIADRAAHDIIGPADIPAAAAASLRNSLKPGRMAEDFDTALRMEFMFGLDMFAHYGPLLPDVIAGYSGSEGSRNRPILFGILRPYLNLEEINYIRYMSASLEHYRLPARQTAAQPLPLPKPRGLGTALAQILVPVFSKANAKRDQSLAQMRLLSVVLALKAHRREHGSYPATLIKLSSLPPTEDPFSGKPFTYRRESGGFVLYSIGPNLKDDGGREPSEPGKIAEEGDIVWNCPR